MRGLLAAFACALFAGCVRGTYRTVARFTEPESARVSSVQVGDELQSCLDSLGAPYGVLERQTQDEIVLVYAWERAAGWRVGVSGGQNSQGASLSVGSGASGADTLVLFFGDDNRLTRIERGNLPADLASQLSVLFDR